MSSTVVSDQPPTAHVATDKQKHSHYKIILLLLAKGGKFLKALKGLKFLITFGTMALSIFAYSFKLGLPMAVGFVILLLVHELGHVWAMRNRGLPTSAPVFIPFLGALVFAPKFQDRDTEAYVGIGGPVLGTLGALAVFALWAILPSHPPLLLLASNLAIFLNLFNLIPIRPLDGGRITQASGRGFLALGAAALLVCTIVFGQPIFLLIWLMVISEWRTNDLTKGLVAGALWLAMVLILMLAPSAATMSIWERIFDITLGAIIAFPLILGAQETLKKYGWSKEAFRTPEGAAAEPPLPSLPRRQRVRWAAAYLALLAILVAVMFWQVALLRTHVPEALPGGKKATPAVASNTQLPGAPSR